MTEFNNILNDAIKAIKDAANSGLGFIGVPSGFKDLDRVLGGFDNSDLIVIGARPSMGKTAFITSMALNMAKLDMPVAIYSLEMTATQLANRMISSYADIDAEKISFVQRMTEDDWSRLANHLETLGKLPIFIAEKSSSKIEDFCKEAKELVTEQGVKVIILDYLQLLSSKEKFQNRYEEVNFITRELKHLARDLNIPIIAASQMNRNIVRCPNDTSREHVPQMFDLRDSGTICDDANVVLLLNRPEYYLRRTKDENGNDIRGLAEVHIAKNHMGREDVVKLRFHPEFCKFEDWKEPDYTSTSQVDFFIGNITDIGSNPVESPF